MKILVKKSKRDRGCVIDATLKPKCKEQKQELFRININECGKIQLYCRRS